MTMPVTALTAISVIVSALLFNPPANMTLASQPTQQQLDELMQALHQRESERQSVQFIDQHIQHSPPAVGQKERTTNLNCARILSENKSKRTISLFKKGHPCWEPEIPLPPTH